MIADTMDILRDNCEHVRVVLLGIYWQGVGGKIVRVKRSVDLLPSKIVILRGVFLQQQLTAPLTVLFCLMNFAVC